MSETPKNRKIDIESVKQELRAEFKEEIENYISDIFDITNTNFSYGASDEDGDTLEDDADSEDQVPDTDPEPEDPKDFDLSLKLKNNNGKFVAPINPENGQLREFGIVSNPDGQGNVSIKVFAKIEGSLQKKPSYFTINYQLID